MFQDQILRFLDATSQWEGEVVVDKHNTFSLNNFPGNPIDCFIFERSCNIDEMECEDDERYYFSTPDYRVRVLLNRFQTRIILKQLNPVKFTDERIDFIIKMAWNYPKIALNKKTASYEPYNDGKFQIMPPIPTSGGPPVKVVYIEE